MPRAFIDTNIAVYAVDQQDPVKRAEAKRLITDLLNEGQAVVSSQVLAEFANAALKKLQIPAVGVQAEIRLLASNEVVVLSTELICRATEVRVEHQVSFWDACILAAAQAAGCEVVYSEDLNAGQWYGSVQVVNPFAQ